MAILILAVIGALILWFEVPQLRRQNRSKELRSFSIMFTGAMVLALVYLLDVPLPNPNQWFAWMMEPLSHLIIDSLDRMVEQ
ncbi:hypothetical protein [Paenibacillus apiarius]|uniref:Uncharacterized protein n=1 Tax=Paenibacillus apiarius TaxID=46240 RepID=A0ABT4DSU6_9BACL|nr:hypothetical protein [Paenibacillus apiarius]MCY9515753.1 hypothetical protein [Paenibacillus apiarius]MCY9520433.1 hypothetical protein [Paenibacillus apiarius]MCY9550567.1 hypothetical protein [Paenibacillus apiarius]MCY9559087.1 hypothetical protein [Paenibacillus apiarius]MCY9683118.1 hypothetical protein [Paenibacillus apiarius]